MTVHIRMSELLDRLDEVKFSAFKGTKPARAVKLPKKGLLPFDVEAFRRTGKQQKLLMRVARKAKEKGHPEATKLAVKRAREAGAKLAIHRELSRKRAVQRMGRKEKIKGFLSKFIRAK